MPCKERVVANLARAVDAEPLGRVAVEEADEERPGVRVDLLGEAERVLEDLAVHLVRVLVVERREASELCEGASPSQSRG